eukprot:TRINITY_DN23_c0_g1_i1.p1 TRINITY_DN23_c0_g1~~TRINITY_DN23_c0_g1_i1.p1  ORF type:complete len:335 (-),score=36.32 TRINITY_DN23_c0_g1_i1:152-1156(-)
MERKETVKICVTGAAGQIAYSLYPMIASGMVFGPEQPVEIRMHDIPSKMECMRGVSMELEDCRYPLLKSVKYGSEAREMMDSIDWCVMLASLPMLPGEERRDLIKKNTGLMKKYSEVLNVVGHSNTKILVVTNPANTMAYVLSRLFTKIPKQNITSLSMVDHNRALSQIAKKLGAEPYAIRNVVCWGNHSRTVYPDMTYATVEGRPVLSKLKDEGFINREFLDIIRNRAFEIQKARQLTAGFSTAAAIRDHIKAIVQGTPAGEWVTIGVHTDKQVYGMPDDLYVALPVMGEEGEYEIVQGLKWDDFTKAQIEISIKELVEERTEADNALANVSQ